MARHKPKLVIIEWEDSRRPDPEWSFLTEYSAPGICACVSVGYLVADYQWMKVLAPNLADIHSINDGMQISGVIHIPASSITKITELVENKRSDGETQAENTG